MTTADRRCACVFGLMWGDEGKGKVVDLLSPGFDVVVRFNGGANAGHTVWAEGERFALHLLPTGALHEDTDAVIGPGVVVDPIGLIAEIDALAEQGIDVTPRLRISNRAHMVMAYHKLEDQLGEQAASNAAKIGTTARGIGPCYADKMRRRSALRFADLTRKDLHDRVSLLVRDRCAMFKARYGQDGGMDESAVLADVDRAKDRLGALVTDTTDLLHQALEDGRSILFEGANGLLLDVDHGTYPFVTSSSTGPQGIGPGAGVPVSHVGCIVGVVKAYATRVGGGPFTTELDDEVGERIRQAGNEFGTTTGRPRRCGWFDAVACAHSARIGGATDMALMHLDTLTGFERIGICTAYRVDGEATTIMPADSEVLARVEPVIEFLPGWSENLRDMRTFDQLPQTAKDYVARLETLVRVPVSIIGVGPDRSQILVRERLEKIMRSAGQ